MARKHKIAGTHTDSNVTRAKQKEEKAVEFKNALPQSNLNDIPTALFLRNEEIYKLIVEELTVLGAFHLVGIDKFTLISLTNTFDLLNEAEKIIAKDGLQQILLTREGATKIIPNPMLQQRNTLITTLSNQLKNLQLDPSSRQALIETVSNDINHLISNDDDQFIKELLKGGM
ncbi:P27 family phage terminase small subunit [Priestia megaterium]|uniref:P27 family phage terminase small subunit n=1 Tax=Priestia megaterium TaxID=1404 RepID=UPI002378CE7C|nr:P27 family phage terminase small subunit [Priestia megaterium]WDM33688.1 P27 family phage terminase small subunit [Priestia megaterium]